MLLTIFPGRFGREGAQLRIYNEAYHFWKSFWVEEMARSGGDRRYVDADDFLRQSEILLVTAEAQIVSMVMSTLYNLSIPSERDSKYFSKLDQRLLDKITEAGPLVSTIEFLAVNPEWRGARPGAPMSAVMIDLALRRGFASGANVCIGMPRVDNRVNSTAHHFGAESLGTILKVNIECEIVAFHRGKITPHPKPEVNTLARGLINKAVILSDFKSTAKAA